MDRVYIVGGSGSGKTTLSRQIGRVLDIEPFDFDTDARADREAVASADRWVIEGIFLYEIQPILERAELVIWLDLPARIAIRRIIVRHFWLSFRRRNRHRGLRLLWQFVRSTPGYYTEPAREPRAVDDWNAMSRALTAKRLAPHSAKVVHLKTPREVRRFRAAFPSLLSRQATSAS